MSFRSVFVVSSVLALGVSHAAIARAADEYRVEPLAEAAPADALSPEIAAQLAPAGFKVIKGTSRTVCSFWPLKQLAVRADFKPTASILYPLELGQLVGVVSYKRSGADFRGNEIPAGTYTVRYSLQPEDGNHVGTFDTRDFFVLLKAADDKSPAIMAKEQLFKLSAAASGATHPCILPLLSAQGAAAETPTLEHDEEHDRWIALFAAKTTAGGALPIRLVVVGKAAE